MRMRPAHAPSLIGSHIRLIDVEGVRLVVDCEVLIAARPDGRRGKVGPSGLPAVAVQ
jgi:hypothetical protein